MNLKLYLAFLGFFDFNFANFSCLLKIETVEMSSKQFFLIQIQAKATFSMVRNKYFNWCACDCFACGTYIQRNFK